MEFLERKKSVLGSLERLLVVMVWLDAPRRRSVGGASELEPDFPPGRVLVVNILFNQGLVGMVNNTFYLAI